MMKALYNSGTGRFVPPKLEVRCSCGKRYRVKATKAGKLVRCKKCKNKIRVPSMDEEKISVRTRRAILDEFGINADAAQEAYEEEIKSSYVCSVCAAKLQPDYLSESYGEGGLACRSCKASLVAERPIGDPSVKPEPKELDVWVQREEDEKIKRKATAFGVLFFVGILCLTQVLGLPWWIGGMLALAIAIPGRNMVYRAESAHLIDDEDDTP